MEMRLSLTSPPAAFACQVLDESRKVIQIACKPVHAVHNYGVTVSGEPQQFRQLRPGSIPAGGFIREDPVQNQGPRAWNSRKNDSEAYCSFGSANAARERAMSLIEKVRS